jgi:hypothetical protein
VWVGFDDFSKGSQVFWPERRSVTVEHNIYFKPTSASEPLKGEKFATAEKLTSPIVTQSNLINAPEPETSPMLLPPSTDTPEMLSEHQIRKPSQHVQDLISGKGHTSACPSDPLLATGIPKPLSLPPDLLPIVEEHEGMADEIMVMLEEKMIELDEELAMVVMMAEAEGLDPTSLAEAK